MSVRFRTPIPRFVLRNDHFGSVAEGDTLGVSCDLDEYSTRFVARSVCRKNREAGWYVHGQAGPVLGIHLQLHGDVWQAAGPSGLAEVLSCGTVYNTPDDPKAGRQCAHQSDTRTSTLHQATGRPRKDTSIDAARKRARQSPFVEVIVSIVSISIWPWHAGLALQSRTGSPLRNRIGRTKT